MPTTDGQETIDEALTRLRTSLARVRTTIARAETNGASFSLGGVSFTQIEYDRLIAREAQLSREIARLEALRAGAATNPGCVILASKFDK